MHSQMLFWKKYADDQVAWTYQPEEDSSYKLLTSKAFKQITIRNTLES